MGSGVFSRVCAAVSTTQLQRDNKQPCHGPQEDRTSSLERGQGNPHHDPELLLYKMASMHTLTLGRV